MNSAKKARRPFFLWVLAIGMLYAALLNGLRLYTALHNWQFLSSALPVRPGPLYLAVTGGVFLLLFSAAGISLLGRMRFGPRLARAAALLYAVWYWFDRLVITQPGAGLQNTVFAAGATLVLVGFTLAAANLLEILRNQ